MSGSLNTEANAEPNLTPILDMVFQLITFFMLVINFKTNAIDRNLALPVVGSAAPVDAKDARELMIININKKDQVTMFNQVVEPAKLKARIQQEGVVARTKYNLKEGDKIPATVVIRSDGAAKFGIVNAVLKDCQEQGFLTFSFKALNKPPEDRTPQK